MVYKTIVMFGLYLLPFALIISGIITSGWLTFLLYLVAGMGMAGIGMGVMHDAIHGSYSSNPKVNKILGYSMNIIGSNANIWRIQHNVLHHTYTNINEADEDIDTPSFLRFSPEKPLKKIHRLQHIYVWFFYGLSTLSWVTIKDYVSLKKYRDLGFIKGGKKYIKEIFQISIWKVIYYSFTLVLPIIFSPVSWWVVLLAFITMHFVTGIWISMVFQAAHVMPESEFSKPNEDGVMESNWHVHQMLNTNNFSPKNRLFSWFIGGLNFQIEHHLWPNISHVHYRKLSNIIKETAQKYDVPYNEHKNFFAAIAAHTRMLKRLGRGVTA